MDSYFVYKSAKKAYICPILGEHKGIIPTWITGSLYRNGPAKFEVGSDKYKHAFDGLAMVQKYSIKNGQVEFSSQYVHSDAYLQNMAANRIVVSEFGTAAYPDPCRTIFNRLSLFFETGMTDNTSVCVYPIGDELFTATETSVIHRIDPDDLSTIGSVRLPNILSIHRATAHQHIDSDTGLVHLLGFIHHPVPSYAIVTLPPISKKDSSNLQGKFDMEGLLKEAKIIGKVNARWKWNPSYNHSFGITENYYIIFECPLSLSIVDVMKAKITASSFANALKWWPQEKTLIHIMKKDTGELVSNIYVTDPLFTFHHINSYEEEDHVVIDYCGYDDGLIIADFFIDKTGKKSQISKCLPKRLVIPLKVNKTSSKDENFVKLQGTSCTANIIGNVKNQLVIHCTQELLSTKSYMELPSINYNAYNGKKYRYLYGVHGMHLMKVDTLTKESITWSNDIKDSFVCESVFLKNPEADDKDSRDEDFGILLCPVIVRDESIENQRYQSLVFIDAKTMKETGRVVFPSVSIPLTFHGVFQKKM